MSEDERHWDERGFFFEVHRQSHLDFAVRQVSHSMSFEGVIKAWHIHEKQSELWYLVAGVIKAVVYYPDQKVLQENVMSPDQRCFQWVPPGVWHGYKVLQGPCHLIYLMDREYDPTDEYRKPHDAVLPGYDWLKGAPIT